MPTLREDLVNSGIKDRVYHDVTKGGLYLAEDVVLEKGKMKLKIVYPIYVNRTFSTNYTLSLELHLQDVRVHHSTEKAYKRRGYFT